MRQNIVMICENEIKKNENNKKKSKKNIKKEKIIPFSTL